MIGGVDLGSYRLSKHTLEKASKAKLQLEAYYKVKCRFLLMCNYVALRVSLKKSCNRLNAGFTRAARGKKGAPTTPGGDFDKVRHVVCGREG